MRGDHSHDAQIRAMYESGLWSMQDIADELHFSRTTIHRRLHAMEDVEIYPRGGAGWRTQLLSNEELERTRTLYLALGSYKAVAREMGLSWETIRDRVKLYGMAA